jgi:hypothetical protein
MTTQNLFESNARVSTSRRDNAESSENKRELTDQEIACVAGGKVVAGTNTIVQPPPGTTTSFA